jgi:sulfur carrier protein ThiS adenylyltransferase
MPRVGIAGVGGIGSNIAVHLVRSGFYDIKIVDFDKVDKSNLNRQFYFSDQIGKSKVDSLEINLKRIDPKASIEKEEKLLTKDNIEEVFADCSIVVEGFDKAHCKSMIVEAFANTSKRVISACGVAGLDIDKISVRKVFKNVTMVGDFQTDVRDKKLFSPKVFIVSSIMANLILKELGFSDDLIPSCNQY